LLTHFCDLAFLKDADVSEIGCGSYFTPADMMQGLGVEHVNLADFLPLELSDRNRATLTNAKNLKIPRYCSHQDSCLTV